MKKNHVIIMGRNYTSILGMVRAVSVTNFDITVIRSVSSRYKSIKNRIKRFIYGGYFEKYSKYIMDYHYAIEPDRNDLFNKIIKVSHYDEYENVILIPTDDFTASTVDLYIGKYPNNFLYQSINKSNGKVVELMNKDNQKDIVETSGMKTAKSWVLEYKDGNYVIPEDIKYPLYTKPLVSFNGSKTIMKKCSNYDELINNINRIPNKSKCPVLAEEFIEIHEEYAILGCSYNGNVIMPGIIRMIKSGNGAHKGVTMIGEIKQFDSKSDLYNKLEQIIKKTNFNGLFDIDLYESNGIMYFNELNLRFGASGYSVTKAGVNLPSIFINYLLNQPVSLDNNVKELTFINEKVNFEDYEAGYMSYSNFKDNEKKADFGFIKSNDDPKPYTKYRRKVRFAQILKRIKIR